MSIQTYLDSHNFTLHPSPPDGHCFIHSVVTAYTTQLTDEQPISYDDLLSKFETQTLNNVDLYSRYLNVDVSEVKQDPVDVLLKGLALYTKKRIYNQDFGDLVPLITANALGCDILIFKEQSSHVERQRVYSDATSPNLLYVHRRGDHYNGLVPISPGPAPQESYAPVTTPDKQRVTYSRDQLFAVRDARNHNVPRATRKRLFQLRLWQPQSSRIAATVKSPNQQNSPTSVNSDSNIKFALLNAQSANNKSESICDFITSQKLDICAITETWLRDNDPSSLGAITPNGYDAYHVPRQDRSGGGVAIVYKQSLCLEKHTTAKRSTFELLHVSFTLDSEVLQTYVIYHPRGICSSEFIDEFCEIADDVAISSGKLLILGDFNFHVDDPSNAHAARFLNILDSYNLEQHVKTKTHTHGHTLDLVITRSGEIEVRDLELDDTVPSDHSAVVFTLPYSAPGYKKHTLSFRQWKKINTESIKDSIRDSDLLNVKCDNVADYITNYNDTLRKIVDEHAPLVTRQVVIRPDTSWYTREIGNEKRKRRQLERRWRRTGSNIDRQCFQVQRSKVNALIIQAKCAEYRERIASATSTKELFKITNNLLHKKKVSVLPSHESTKGLADKFIQYFSDKITAIRDSLYSDKHDTESPTPLSDPSNAFEGVPLCELPPATEDEIAKIIRSSPTKSCSLDPLPTWLLKDCLDVLLPVVTEIVNLSMTNSDVPPPLKRALILPLIKKLQLDPEVYKNYRPVSNLPYISKLIERVVAKRLVDHLVKNNLYEKNQSAYRELHSTETALLRVHNDIQQIVDTDGAAVLVLLDLSAAFDTIDHARLLSILEHDNGVTGPALAWFKSYLSDRSQAVSIGGCESQQKDLIWGVPQGSVLGPILFTLYTSSLGDLIRKHNIYFHLYADDTQLYLSFKFRNPTSGANAIESMNKCLADIKLWMRKNMLKLNDSKTEFLFITTQQQKNSHGDVQIKVGDCYIPPSDTARNLGVIFDSTFNQEAHINSICKKAYSQIRAIGRIRKYLDVSTTKKLVNSLVTVHLDYCNSLLYGLPSRLLQRLQKIQNTAARLILKIRKYDHITPALKKLHWLPVEYRINFKLMLMVYKSTQGLAPSYICDLLTPYHPMRSLRSMNSSLFTVPRTRLSTFGDRSFAKAAPSLWNGLPDNIKHADSVPVFKQRLKTYLFSLAYE